MKAPIVLFAFARFGHTQKTLAALQANQFSDESDLIIYSDAARSEAELAQVGEVRTLLRQVTGFKSVKIIERGENFGLARNIIEGLTEVFQTYDRAIILEDDIVTSPNFLEFMNRALDRYVDEPAVWHINGWNFPVQTEGLDELFFWRVMNCWGWATWANRWKRFTKDPGAIIHNWSFGDRYRFNVDGSFPFFSHIVGNYTGKNSTWAVFWYATIYSHGGLCLTPAKAMTRNIGNDGSGTHSLTTSIYDSDSGSIAPCKWPEAIVESSEAIEQLKLFFKRSMDFASKARAWYRMVCPLGIAGEFKWPR